VQANFFDRERITFMTSLLSVLRLRKTNMPQADTAPESSSISEDHGRLKARLRPMRDLKQEEFWVVVLNTRQEVVRDVHVAVRCQEKRHFGKRVANGERLSGAVEARGATSTV
jgi:hypothetical protein